MSVSQYIPPPLVVAELQLPSKDLAHLGGLERSKDGVLNYDFAVTAEKKLTCVHGKHVRPAGIEVFPR